MHLTFMCTHVVKTVVPSVQHYWQLLLTAEGICSRPRYDVSYILTVSISKAKASVIQNVITQKQNPH